MYAYFYIFTCVHKYVYKCVYVYIRIYICICMRVYIYMYIYVYTCMYMRIYIYVCVCLYMHICTFTTQSTFRSVVNKACTFSNSYTYTDSFCGASHVCVCMQYACVHTHMHAEYACVQIHINAEWPTMRGNHPLRFGFFQRTPPHSNRQFLKQVAVSMHAFTCAMVLMYRFTNTIIYE